MPCSVCCSRFSFFVSAFFSSYPALPLLHPSSRIFMLSTLPPHFPTSRTVGSLIPSHLPFPIRRLLSTALVSFPFAHLSLIFLLRSVLTRRALPSVIFIHSLSPLHPVKAKKKREGTSSVEEGSNHHHRDPVASSRFSLLRAFRSLFFVFPPTLFPHIPTSLSPHSRASADQ